MAFHAVSVRAACWASVFHIYWYVGVYIYIFVSIQLYVLYAAIQYKGGTIDQGQKIFPTYRPLCFIEADVRSEKYWLVCGGLLANRIFFINFICLSDSLTARVE